jgi:ribosomal protein L11 methyltransferase
LGRFGKEQQAPAIPASIRHAIQDRIVNGRCFLTARGLVQDIAQQQNCPQSVVYAAVRRLIEEGFLEYHYTFGQSYLVVSFRRPVALTPRFTVIPPGHARTISPSKIPIVIAPGVSFGDGRHPTTCLALQALEQAWAHFDKRNSSIAPCAVDIGTGSGILAIAAANLGAARVLALDIDACARSEARHNIRLNPEAERVVEVAEHSLESIEEHFDLAMANLRLPTLAGLGEWLRCRLNPLGCVVVSGCREEEWDPLVGLYREKGLHLLWHDAKGGWAGGVFLGEEERLSEPGPKKADSGCLPL